MAKNNLSDLRFKIYARKSSESEDRQVQSIEDQIKYLNEIVKNQGLKVVGKPLVESKSAKTPENRPIFRKLIESIESGEADAILCWHINRLSRNPIDSGKVLWLLQKGIIKAIQTHERLYLPDDNVLLISLDSGMSTQYSLDLSKNVKRGMQSKLEKGWFTAVAPPGYFNDTVHKTIIHDPERYPIVRRMWDTMLTGRYSPPEIHRMANNKWGYRTRQSKRIGGGKLTRSSIYKIFTNPFYMGTIRWNGKTYVGNHTPMVTPDEFNHVQKLLGRKGHARPIRKQFAYTGLIRCGECGCSITAEEKTKAIQGTTEVRKYIYYHCTRKKLDKLCSQRKNIQEKALEEQIATIISKYNILPEFRAWGLEALQESHQKEVSDRKKVHESQQRAIEAVENKKNGLMDLLLRSLISEDEYRNKKASFENELVVLQAELKQTDKRSENWLELVEKAFDFVTYAPEAFKNGDLETRKSILLALGSNWTLRDGKLSIQAHSWLQPIGDDYPPLDTAYRRLEPVKTVENKERTALLGAVRMSWLGR